MVVYTDKHHTCLVLKESIFNTPVTPTLDLGLCQGLTPSSNNTITSHYTTGRRDLVEQTAGVFTNSIDGSFKFQHGRVFTFMFGAARDDNTASDYRHVFVDIDNELSGGAKALPDTGLSFTMENGFDSSSDITETFAGCKVASITLNNSINNVLTMDVNISGSSVDTGTSAGTKVLSTIPLFIHSNDNNSFGAESSEVAQTILQTWGLTLAQDIQPIDGNSREHVDMVENNLNVTFTFTKIFDDKVMYERFLGGTTSSTGTPTNTSFIFNNHNGVALGSGRREFYAKVIGQIESHDKPIEINSAIIATFQCSGRLKVLYTVDGTAALS